MSINFNVKKSENFFNLPPEGIYDALISDGRIADNTVYDKNDKKDYEVAVFTFTLDNGKLVFGRFILNLKINSPINHLLNAGLGDYGEDADLADLIGKKVKIKIKHNTKEGKKYANIVNVYPVSDASKSFVEVTDANELETMIGE